MPTTTRWVFAILLVLVICGAHAEDAALAVQLQRAHAGETVILPAGIINGGMVLPAGVSLRGAGYGKTVIDATGMEYGVLANGTQPTTISDLTVVGGKRAGVVLDHARRLTVARVRTHRCGIGVLAAQATDCRVENCLSDDNWCGISISGARNVVVNCTIAECTTGLELPAGADTVAFNNCITGAAIGVNIGAAARVRLDYNLYAALRTGVLHGIGAKLSVLAWSQASGFDRHSVQYPVTFRDPSAGDFHPSNLLLWAPARATTSAWGCASFTGVRAPLRDIDGKAWSGVPDVGACAALPPTPRPADGAFIVSRGVGLTSAGLFTADGVLINYLFHNLPLRRGAYAYRLPNRTFDGKPIVPGRYEVRVTESALRLRHLANTPANPTTANQFSIGGKQFVVRASVHEDDPQILISRDEAHPTPVLALTVDPADWRWVTRRDTNGDGRIDIQDSPTPLTDAAGKPLRYGTLVNPWTPVQVQPNGDLLILWGQHDSIIWKCRGLDAQGVPSYTGEDRLPLPNQRAGFISPYDGRPDGVIGYRGAMLQPDGGYRVNVATRGGNPGGCALFGVGSDLAACDRNGALRWWHSLGETTGICGLAGNAEVTLTSLFGTADLLAVDADGLGLGILSTPTPPTAVPYTEPRPGRLTLQQMKDGSTSVQVNSGQDAGLDCYRLEGLASVRKSRAAVTISEARAQELAKPPLPADDTPTVRVPSLAQPLPVDGNLDAWRQAVPAPQILLLPRGDRDVRNPADCSAVVRLAHTGQELYLQVIRFDNAVTFHQPYNKSFLQDTMELMLNGFGEGFQFSISRYADVGESVVRRGVGSNELLLPAELAPRSVTVLRDARDLPEMLLIEHLTGADLSACKAIITTLKVPIDARTYAGKTQAVFSLSPGSTARLGIMIDDNDEPGTDQQRTLAWPATFSTFAPKEAGGLLLFE